MNSALLRCREALEAASAAEKIILEYIINQPEETVVLSVRELAVKTFSSTSTIIRLCNKLGFSGYKDFKKTLAYEMASFSKTSTSNQTTITQDDSTEAIIEKITNRNIAALCDTRALMDVETLQNCITILKRSSCVYLFGVGTSLATVQDAQMKFIRLGKPCITSPDWHTQLLYARKSKKTDVGIVISYQGQAPEMLECIKAMVKNGTPVISITRFGPSPIKEHSTHVLCVAANPSNYYSNSVSSRISEINMVDILCAGYSSPLPTPVTKQKMMYSR